MHPLRLEGCTFDIIGCIDRGLSGLMDEEADRVSHDHGYIYNSAADV